jgi:hypothetical protein
MNIEQDLEQINSLTEKITGCAIEVHRHLGPGTLSSGKDVLCVLCASVA